MRNFTVLVFAFLTLAATGASAQSSHLYASFGNELTEVDRNDGNSIGAPVSTGSSVLKGMAMRHASHVMFGVTSGGSTCAQCLVTVNLGTGVLTPVGPLGVPIGDLAFSNSDTLFGVSPNGSQLYTINTTTGAATALPSPTGISASTRAGLSFGGGGNLFLSAENDNGASRIVDRTTGIAAAPSATLSGSNCTVGGAAGCPVVATDVDPFPPPGQSAFLILSQGDPAIPPATFGGGGVFLGSEAPGGALTRITGPNTVTNANSLAFFVPAAPVPALNDWALAGLALLFAAGGVLIVRRRIRSR